MLHGGEIGAEIQMDSRGRIVLPAWLRRLSEASGSVLVAAPSPGVSVVVVLPTCALDELVNAVVGEVGVDDDGCEQVLADAVARAQQRRPGSDGRSSREHCV